ncbi:MORC family CW-type zinc finger protein 3a [Clupea harengus]|uniref:MORC family CW-type zinc finger protein 3a n=1 Tax=Clupea harengus TaxID=7950 RepID=A0A6P8GPU7_CLUHA|nr:MORC family CW-type zinc finger protein 3a [Clupea harengus]
MAAQTDRGIPLSALSPKFLHTNSTSHTWPFSAIAELVDNAYDPDVSAKQFWIDKTRIRNVDCLTFMDNGNGLIYQKMHKMLSFGFSDKQTINGHVPVGLYGNGFKSGSMRLGKDAIVFSKTHDSMCVGMLSQTYLEQTSANHVVVPIVAFRRTGNNLFRPAPEHSASLQDILKYSLFKSVPELDSELRTITANGTTATSGTRIIIWNLRRSTTGQMEFEFNRDKYDIQIPPTVFESNRDMYKRPELPMESHPESDSSLQAYCSILYLKPRMQIIIRGQKVKTQLVSKNLAYSRKDSYKPNFLTARVPITFGYNTKSKDHYGIMMYHKNRLIKAYERVGCQRQANIKGVGVIGVIECNFLKPTHNKQDFDYTDEYRKTINSVALKLEEYWKEIRFKREKEDPTSLIPLEDTFKRPDQNWVQCDKCLQWRKLPDGIDPEKLPTQWFCHMNPDPQFRSCHVPQEAEDSDDDLSYPKTYKQHERLSKIHQERQKQLEAEAKKKEEMQRLVRLAQQNEELRRQHERLKIQLRQTSSFRVSVPPPPLRSALATAPHSSSTLSQAGPSPSSHGMPIISSVCSLSTPTRMKRMQTSVPDSVEAKKARSNHPGKASEGASTSSSAAATCQSPTVVIPDDDDDEEDDEDCANGRISSGDEEDIVIDETKSTPKPKAPTFDISKVKTELRGVSEVPGILMECSDDAAPEVPKLSASSSAAASSAAASSAAASAATPTRSPSSPEHGQVSTTTQTEASVDIKEEKEEVKSTKDTREENRPNGEEEEERTDMGVSSFAEEEAAASAMDVAPDKEGCSASPSGSEEKAREGMDDEGDSETNAIQARETEPQTDGERGLMAMSRPTDPNPSETPYLAQAQLQQDQLMELLEKTAKERDTFQGEVHQLIVKVEDLEQTVRTLTQDSVKKEPNHQACQTDKRDDEKDYTSLQQQIERLQKERDALAEEKRQWEKNGGEGSSSSTQKDQKEKEGPCTSQVEVDDEMALQVDSLLRELDQRNAERDELKNKLDSLDVEKAALASRMEQLQKELEDVRKDGYRNPVGVTNGQPSAVDSSQQEDRVDTAGGSSPSHQAQTNGSGEPRQNGDADVMEVESQGEDDAQTSSQTHNSPRPGRELKHRLSELRRSVGRLLVTFVPALDLNQVNYNCSVIDEILDQVLQEISQSENGIDAS